MGIKNIDKKENLSLSIDIVNKEAIVNFSKELGLKTSTSINELFTKLRGMKIFENEENYDKFFLKDNTELKNFLNIK